MKPTLSLVYFITTSILIVSCKSHSKNEYDNSTLPNQHEAILPSWNTGNARQSIIDFVKKTTSEGSPDFIPVADRIACFDNDGTLWSEQPYYFQLAFAMYQIKKMAPQHPEWKQQQPFKALLSGDMKTVMSGGEKSLAAIVSATHSGMSTEQFTGIVSAWMNSDLHPTTVKPYSKMIFQPMLELLQYLRANGYTTFIVSGGGVDFMRAWAEDVYGIPPYQVIGSEGGYRFENKDGKSTIIKLPSLVFNDDKAGKPIGIQKGIGKIPVIAVGNSDGDYEMLQYTGNAGGYPRLCMLIHHTDSTREWAYDKSSAIGKLDKGLQDAPANHWMVVDMKQDWNTIFPK